MTMLQTSTSVPITPWQEKIRFPDRLLLLGSCFTEHIGDRLQHFLYPSLVNPFGILYHPVPIARALERIAGKRLYTAEELVVQDNLYHSLDHHGAFSGPDPDRVLARLNSGLAEAHEWLSTCRVVFISPGTANGFRYLPTGEIAGNCHKIPQSAFARTRLSLGECADVLDNIRATIRSVNPSARIVWTVSPVRHLRDGLIENQRSKAILLLGIEEILRRYPETHYFPGYEILHDELRDYRYYDLDMTHPSPLAVEVIWDRFVHAYLAAEDVRHHAAIDNIRRAMGHRFLHEDQRAIRQFARQQLARIDEMERQLPMCHWQPIRQYFFHLVEPD